MSWHSVIDTEFSCQQPKNHPFYMACKENIDLEKNDEDEPQKPEDKGDAEGPEGGWWTRERVC